MINIPRINSMRKINDIEKGNICIYRYNRIPNIRYSNIAIINKNDDVYLQRHTIHTSGIVEFIVPPKDNIKMIMISPCDKSINFHGFLSFFSPEELKKDNDNNVDIYNMYNNNIIEQNEIIKTSLNTLEEYEKRKEKLLLDTLNIICIPISIICILGFYKLSFFYAIGGLTNIMYILILDKEIDDICVRKESVMRIPLFPLRIILIIIIASIITQYNDIATLIAFFFGFSSGKIALYIDYIHDCNND